MKLYTYCDAINSELKIVNKGGCKREEYSYEEYLKFLSQSKKYYIHMYHYHYETDMSDNDEGSDTFDFSINYNNMIIKDNELYGVLVKTTTFTPKYLIYPFGEYNCGIELEGGYNSNSFDWWYQENDLDGKKAIDASIKYVLIKEQIYYKENSKEISLYLREVINLTQKDFIIKDDEVIGVLYHGHQYLFEEKNSLRVESYPNVYTLVEIDEKFLEKDILDVCYDDFSKCNYCIFK